MNSLLPVLAALWLCGRSGGKERPPPTPASAPLWPTTISPPPLPAFMPSSVPQPPHVPEAAAPTAPTPSAETATPLATLLHHPPTPPTTHAAPSAPIPRHTRAAAKAIHPAAAVHKAAAQQLAKMAPHLPWKGPPIGPQAITARAAIPKPAPKTTLRQAVVADLQKIMIARGARITADGLYGPKTAGAWSELAHKKGLPPQIKRVNSKIASVSSVTYDALAVPP